MYNYKNMYEYTDLPTLSMVKNINQNKTHNILIINKKYNEKNKYKS